MYLFKNSTPILLTLAILLSGCVIKVVPPVNTPSGKPEIVITGVKKKRVMNMLVSRMLARQYRIGTATDYHIEFKKQYTTSAHINSKWVKIKKEKRVTFNAVEVKNGVHVTVVVENVASPGRFNEQVTESRSQTTYRKLQNLLEEVRAELKR